jgi:hypothetical protein
MFRPYVLRAICRVVAQVPVVAGLDPLTTTPTKHVARFDQGSPLLTQGAVVGTVAALGGGAAGVPVAPPAVRTAARSVVGERSGWAPRGVGS